MTALEEIDAARLDDRIADDLAARAGVDPVSPGRRTRIAAIPLGAFVVLPGLLILLNPSSMGSWAALTMGALLVVAGAGVTASRSWGAPLAILACVCLALRAGSAAVETGAGWPLVALAVLASAGATAIYVGRRRRLRTAIARIAPDDEIRTWRRERARAGPPLWRAIVAVAGVYAVFATVAFVYHRMRGIDAPFGIAVQGRDLVAFALRTSFYVLTIVAALAATKGHGAAPASPRDRVRHVGFGVLLLLGTFALLTSIGSLLDLVAALRGTGAGAVAQAFRSGLEAETARPDRGFDPIRFAYVALLAPLGEELLFRWTFLRGLRTRLPFVAAALGQALVFALLHRYRFAAYQTLLIGLASAWAVERTGRIVPGVVGHGLWNGLQSL